MPELTLTLDAMYRAEKRKNKFLAALQGIDIDGNSDSDGNEKEGSKKASLPTVEEVQARAIQRLTGDKNAAGATAAGITADMGTEYKIMEGTEIG
jgi:hypothetical protein